MSGNSSVLRKIAAALTQSVAEEEIDREAIRTAARRINAQAEMVEEGLID